MITLPAIFGLLLGCQYRPTQNAGTALKWRAVYKNDQHGNALAGNKTDLVRAIRSGSTLKVGWGWQKDDKSMEHLSEPIWHLVLNDEEVIVHLDPQVLSYTVWDSLSANYADSSLLDLEWRVVLSTKGEFDAVWYNRRDHKVAKRMPQRHIMTWYVQQDHFDHEPVPLYSPDPY